MCKFLVALNVSFTSIIEKGLHKSRMKGESFLRNCGAASVGVTM